MKKIIHTIEKLEFECDCGCKFETDEYIKSTFMDTIPVLGKSGETIRGQNKCIKAVCPQCRQELIY